MSDTIQIIRELFAAFDGGRMEAVGAVLAEDLYFQFGSLPPGTGRDAPGKVTGSLFTHIVRIQHELTHVWAPEPDVVVAEMWVTYDRDDGARFRLPCANTFRLRGGMVTDYRVYMDINPILG